MERPIGTNAPAASVTTDPRPTPGRHDRGASRSTGARVLAVVAVLAAIVVVALIFLGNGSGYTLKIPFQDASGLVTGDEVLIGPAQVGSVDSIGLTANGQAEVQVSLNG